MERKFTRELSHEEIRKKLGIKGNGNPVLSVGLVKKMHQLVSDHNLSHIAAGRSVGLNVRASNKYLSYPHLKKFSVDKRGAVRMFFSRSDEALATVRALFEKHKQDSNAVAFDLGLDSETVKRLLGRAKQVRGPDHGDGFKVNIAGTKYALRDLVFPPKSKK